MNTQARRSAPVRPGWSSRSRPHFPRRGIIALLCLAMFGGLFVTASPAPASADSLSNAYNRQKALERQINQQKQAIAALTANQSALSNKLASTRASLNETNANLQSVKAQIVSMVVEVAQAQNSVDELNTSVAQLDAQLADVEAQETAKQQEFDATKALLAARIREAYDTDRTSLLETFLSGQNFGDILTEVGYHLDFAQQDKVLAQQIVDDQQVLAVLHQNVDLARQEAADAHALATQQKATLDGQLQDLNDAKARLAQLEQETQALLAAQQSQYLRLANNKTALQAQLAKEVKAAKELQALIDKLVQEQLRQGGIPSQYSGSLAWPMHGVVTQEFGCTGVWAEPPLGNCAHFHTGIDIANAMYTPIHAAGPGKVIYVGRSPSDPAWIVIIAHSKHLVTLYGHVDNKAHRPIVHVGQYVSAGQTIAYEGMTGWTTGPHLHWGVELDGHWVNPRLFL
jgi:murein DD-endopeptidase MepM/ murein hydrolase activator NlpD